MTMPSMISRRSFAAGVVGLTATGCATPLGGERGAILSKREALKPLDISLNRLMRITVCVRPFRHAGPRLEAEMIAGKRVIHNYGHGGSGWSLSWGYAEQASSLALAGRPKSAAVIGAGAMGLTTATMLQRAGVSTTIFAKDFPAESRSARATGVWSPSSRIAMEKSAGPDFPDRWEALTRRSHAMHQHYVGLAGHPVEFTPRHYLRSDAPRTPID